MSNNYDMAYFNRDQTVVGKADLVKPFTFDTEKLGYRPHYPEEEEARRASLRREAVDIVEAARAAEVDRPGAAGA